MHKIGQTAKNMGAKVANYGCTQPQGGPDCMSGGGRSDKCCGHDANAEVCGGVEEEDDGGLRAGPPGHEEPGLGEAQQEGREPQAAVLHPWGRGRGMDSLAPSSRWP